MFYSQLFFSLKYIETAFVSSSFDLSSASIISSHVIAESPRILANSFHFCNYMYQDSKYNLFHIHDVFLHPHRDLPLFNHWSEFYFISSNLHLHSLDISFANIFYSFFPVIILNTYIFESFVLIGTQTFLGKSLRVLQLPNTSI